MAGMEGRLAGLVAKYQTSCYHTGTILVKEQLRFLEVIEGERDRGWRLDVRGSTEPAEGMGHPKGVMADRMSGHPRGHVREGDLSGGGLSNERARMSAHEAL